MAITWKRCATWQSNPGLVFAGLGVFGEAYQLTTQLVLWLWVAVVSVCVPANPSRRIAQYPLCQMAMPPTFSVIAKSATWRICDTFCQSVHRPIGNGLAAGIDEIPVSFIVLLDSESALVQQTVVV